MRTSVHFGLTAAALVLTPTVSAPAFAQDAAAVGAIDSEALALGQAIVREGYPEETREAMFGGVVDTIIAQMNSAIEQQSEELDPEVKALIERKQADMVVELKQIIARYIPSFMEALSKAYATEFSVEELRDIRNFVSTPSGQAFVSRSTDLVSNEHYVAATQPYMAEVVGASRKWQQEIFTEVSEMMKKRQAN